MREDGRENHKIRPVKIVKNYMRYADGSCLIEQGNTKVICTASIEEKVPPHLKDARTGWVTAEYSLLPRATQIRVSRERFKVRGRTQEIQRLIGRCLRAVCDLRVIGEKTVIVDCDVMGADGGTRTASITGGFISLVQGLRKAKKQRKIDIFPIGDYLGAISVGRVGGKLMLDLTYEEDSAADVDMNLVMTDKGKIVEIQATGEEASFSLEEFNKMLELGSEGIKEIIKIEKEVLGELE